MLPPLPPSPPEGPPRGTYFSRRKATQPLPPSPAFTEILASSTNTRESYQSAIFGGRFQNGKAVQLSAPPPRFLRKSMILKDFKCFVLMAIWIVIILKSLGALWDLASRRLPVRANAFFRG